MVWLPASVWDRAVLAHVVEWLRVQWFREELMGADTFLDYYFTRTGASSTTA